MTVAEKASHYCFYIVVRLLGVVFGIMPVSAAMRVGRGLGSAWFYWPARIPETRVSPRFARSPALKWLASLSKAGNKLLHRFREHRLRAEAHIRESFPALSEAAISRMAHGSMQQLCLMVIELLISPRLISRWAWHDYVELRDLEHAIRTLAARRGCILLTGHYGNIEVLGSTLALIGFDMTAIMRPLDNPYLNRMLTRRRGTHGLKLLDKGGATRHAPDILRNGGGLAFIADQNAGRKGIFVDFFGRKASTYKSIGLLAMQFEVPIIVGCARRIGRGFQYEMQVNRVIEPAEWVDRDDPLLWITQEYTSALEALIREAPEQYLWIHRRWKTRPKDEAVRELAMAKSTT